MTAGAAVPPAVSLVDAGGEISRGSERLNRTVLVDEVITVDMMKYLMMAARRVAEGQSFLRFAKKAACMGDLFFTLRGWKLQSRPPFVVGQMLPERLTFVTKLARKVTPG